MAEADIQAILAEAFRRLNENSRRLREIEERYGLIETRFNTLQANMVDSTEKDRFRNEKNSTQLKSIEDKLTFIENELARVSKLTEKSAKKSDVEALRELISLYNPFVEAKKKKE